MNFEQFFLKLNDVLQKRNAEKVILQGLEPQVVIYRPELDLEIEIKAVEFGGGAVRLVI